MRLAALSSAGREFALLVGLTALYFAAGRLGLSMAAEVQQVTLIWPPTGIAVAAVVLLGTRVWPAILGGAFLVNVTASEASTVALAIAGGNTAEAIVGGSAGPAAALPGRPVGHRFGTRRGDELAAARRATPARGR